MNSFAGGFPAKLLDDLRNARRVTALTGSGISAESGVPTFRDALTGLWSKFRPEDLATPEAFLRNPKLVWEWYAWRRELVSQAQPNAGHLALVELERRVPQFRLITQNVDGLHQRAGSRNVIELHGNITRTKCFEEDVLVESWTTTDETPPRCPSCGGRLRPDVVWFGEALPPAALERALAASQSCDLFFSIGTSTLVHPAASLPFEALQHGATVVEINPDETPLTSRATFALRGPSGVILPEILRTLGVALLVVAGTISSFAAQTFYISPSGNDNNPGTQAQPFREIRKAVEVVAPGAAILVTDGSYLGFDMFDKVGASNAPITIRALGTNAVVAPTTDRSDNRDTIHIEDCAFVIVDGFHSFGANRASVRVQGGHHVTIRNCVFGNNTTWGLFTGFSDDLLIENNECFGSTNEHGIYVSNSGDRPTLRGNRCYSNRGAGIQLNADVNIQPGDGIITGALLENNVIYDNGRGGGGAFNLDGVQDSIIRNNLLFNNHASGIIFFQIDGAEGPRGNQVYHNTIDMAADGRWALNFLQTTGTNVVRNNILLTRHSFRGGLRFGVATDVANTDSDYNIVTRITPDDNAALTLSEWQAQGHEAHSVTGTLAGVFVDADAGNYFQSSNSPALNAAQWVAGLLNDLEGGVRPFGPGPDIGCYEQSPLRLALVTPGNGQRVLRLSGGAGGTLILEASGTLTNWSAAASFVRSNRPLEYIDASPAADRRFFRASVWP